ncbi:MAG: hypothetical protein ACN2B6_12435 [Rickettsiales bacterium]
MNKTNANNWPTHYRFETRVYGECERVVIELIEFEVVRETTASYFVFHSGDNYLINKYKENPKCKNIRKPKRIVKGARSSYCHPSIELAARSFLARQQMRSYYTKRSLDIASAALSVSESNIINAFSDGKGCGILVSEINKTEASNK